VTRLLLFLTFSLAVIAPAAASGTIDQCGRQPDRESTTCLYRASRIDPELRTAAESELQALDEAHPDAGWPSYYLGKMTRWTSEGEGKIRAAAESFARAGEHSGEIQARADLVTLRGFDRDFSGSFAEIERLREVVEQTPLAEDRAIVDIAEAHYRMLTGTELHEAYSRLRDALAALQVQAAPAGYFFEHKEALRALAEVSCDLGILWEADDWAAAAVDFAREHGTPRDGTVASYDAAITRLASGLPTDERRAELELQVREIIEMAQATGPAWIEAASRLLLADLIEGPEVAQQLAESRRLSIETGDGDLERSCILAFAVEAVPSEPEVARELLAQTYDERWGPWTPLDGWADRMHVLWATHSREEALADSSSILSAIEALRRNQVGTSSDLLLSASADAYYWVSGKLLEGSPGQEDVRLSFSVIERLRAQALREALLNQEARAQPSPEELSRYLPLLQELESDYAEVYRGLLDERRSAAEHEALLERLDALERRETRLHLDAASLFPARPRLEPPGPELLPRVQEALADDEALLSYQLGLWRGWDGRFRGGSWVTVTTRSGTTVHRLEADRGVVENHLAILLGLEDPELPEALVLLYRELIESAVQELPESIRKLVIVPDGALHLLPFALLREHAEAEPLVASFEVQTVPSASLWLHWRDAADTPGQEERRALVLANPTLPSTASASAIRSWAFDSRNTLGPLPHAEREGRRVLRWLGGSGKLESGPGASESWLKSEDLSRFSILHFASHAVVNPLKPGRSAVMLAAGTEEEDGFLRPSEIAQLEGLDGKLVVLSACDTAAGSVLRGEGVLSLGRAFFEAGAQAVVASLWRLDDRLTASFFDDFYKHLREGVTVSEALAETQREWSRRGRPASIWAGIVVLGNGDLIPIPGGVPPSPWRAVAFVLAAVALVLAVVLVRRRALARSS
jgi:CHAT domain-containing protein